MAARGRGLALERAHLAAHLAHEVAEALEVLLGCGQAALGPLLAPAVLEDPGRLLDHASAVLRTGVEDGVELALADDHVLLATDARVLEQLLDVEQAAGRAVDGVLRVAGAEERAADGDLGHVDGQASAALSMVSDTSARPSCGREAVPAKMTSSIFALRSARGPWAPSTQVTASTTLDLPEPLGPTTTVTPGSSSRVVVSAKDLKPFMVKRLRNIGATLATFGAHRAALWAPPGSPARSGSARRRRSSGPGA